MPWKSGADYAKRHNKKLSGEAATKAKNVAEGLLAKGASEGKAMRIANAVGNKAMEKRRKLYDNPRSL